MDNNVSVAGELAEQMKLTLNLWSPANLAA